MRYDLRLIPAGSINALKRRLRDAGVSGEGVEIMADKAEVFAIRVENVSAEAANILKQQLLSLGGDAAVHRDVISGSPDSSTAYLIADRARFSRLHDKLKGQPFGLVEVGEEVSRLASAHKVYPKSIPLVSGVLDLSSGPVIMGILNLTPDSFSDGGRYSEPSAALERAEQLVEEGAAIIDIGGESSRPGAKELDIHTEIARVMPALEKIAGKIAVPISIDTRKAAVAEAAIGSGASMINDISGMRHDPDMPSVAIRSGAAVVVMHMQGSPENMQDSPRYSDPVHEIISWLDKNTKRLISEGIKKEKIIIDPGIGFGKRLDDNLDIIAQAADFHTLGFPVMIGYSRKSFIGTITGRGETERVCGGLGILGRCLAADIPILRMHDVKEGSDFIKVWEAVQKRGA